MRLLSSTIRNYRIHRETTVDLSAALNLVGGPNESGKSTLAEAIHRALFLKASVGGEIQKSMVSDRHQGHPEVELRFEAAGKTFQVTKTFSGTNGKTLFSEEGGATLHGPEAESRLAELLQVEEAGGGRGGANKAATQWSHLWVWQGSGGEDPSESAAAHRDALLSRLKESGGGAAMQSTLDSQVVATIQEKYDELFTKGGKPKAGSLLFQANEERDKMAAAVQSAEEAFSRLEEARRSFSTSENTIRSRREESSRLIVDLETARTGLKTVSELRLREGSEQRSFDEVSSQHQQIEQAIAEVEQLRVERQQLAESLEPATSRITVLQGGLKDKKSAVQNTERATDAAEKILSEARDQRELAEVWLRLLEQRTEMAQLVERNDEISALRKTRQAIDAKLALLPLIDEPGFRRLQRLESDLSEAEAVLNALSTDIEVIRTTLPIKVGDEALAEGDEHTIGAETIVTAGDSLVLKITPGGGTDLAEAKRRASEIRLAKQEAFNSAEVKSIAAASEILAQRQSFEARLQTLDGELSGKDAEKLGAKIDTLARELTASEAEFERRSERVDSYKAPSTLDESRSLRDEIHHQMDDLEFKVTEARNQRSASAQLAQQAEEDLDSEKQSAQQVQHRAIEIQAQLQAKEDPLGPKDQWEQNRILRLDAKRLAAQALSKTQSELGQLQPDSLQADVDRLERAIQMGKEEIENAGQAHAVARSILTTDGTTDPAGALEIAHTHASSAKERYESVNRQAEAIRLLRDRFTDEQKKLSDRFSRPLAEKVSDYLKQIFGPTASATVSVDDGKIGGWTMTRDGFTFDFDKLSGGTREQVAAAVRLALAEILAADHGGSLPVVFDDAFTHSDPDRIQSLQRMLDLASRRGLQIILLTCDPTDYNALGAHSVSLASGERS